MEFKILAVDDDKAVINSLTRVFLERGYRILTAESAEEAKSVLENNSHTKFGSDKDSPVDIVLLDIQMPGPQSGLDVLKHIKKDYPATKVIIITGYDEYEEEAKRLGCDAFLTKPVSFGGLIDTMRQLIQKKDSTEVKENSMGLTFSRTPKGALMSDILIIEPFPEISGPMKDHLSSRVSANGYYTVHVLEEPDKALTFQQILRTPIVMIDVRTVHNASEIVQRMKSSPAAPKEFVFYFRPESKVEEEGLKGIEAVWWEGNPFNAEGLRDLSRLIDSLAEKHNLRKE